MKPAICCYTEANVEVVENADISLRAELGYAELFFDVKPRPSNDFFVDPPPSESTDRASHDFFAHSADSLVNRHRDRAFGQHLSYVMEIFARQYRTFIFSVSMSGSCARLLRWDRAGCIVSESFDIREQPELLCDFLWQFSQVTHDRRGHDPTVELASSREATIFLDAVKRHVQSQLEVNGQGLEAAVSEHYEQSHVVAMHVLDHKDVSTGHPIRRFIVSRPTASSLRAIGKGTKGFWAVDPSNHTVVFLKDTWRLPPFHVSEGDTIRLLHSKDVRNIPSVIYYGDVPDFIPRKKHKFTRQ